MIIKFKCFIFLIKDNPAHNVPFIGSMWGLALERDRNVANEVYSILTNSIIARIYNFGSLSYYAFDQYLLANFVWKRARQNATIHDSYHCARLGPSKPFPTRRPEYMCFVTCLGCCDPKINNRTSHICPFECRPKEHPDWIYC